MYYFALIILKYMKCLVSNAHSQSFFLSVYSKYLTYVTHRYNYMSIEIHSSEFNRETSIQIDFSFMLESNKTLYKSHYFIMLNRPKKYNISCFPN